MTAWAAEVLFVSTLLLALVLLLRTPVARMFGARAAYALWLAPLLRMLLPPLPDNGSVPEVVIYTGAAAASSSSASSSTAWSSVTALWLGGAALFLLFHLIQHRRFLARAISSGRRLPIDATGPEIIESPAVPGPIATGVIRQRIFLPAGFGERLTDEQQRLAIAHERLHHRRGDLLALAVSMVVLALHWFNPIAHFAHRAFRRDLEAACDANLIERIGSAERETYARAIVGCAAAPVPRAICTLTSVDDLKRRLMMLEWNHGRLARGIGVSCAIAVALTGLTLGTDASAQDSTSTEKIEKKVIIREVNGDQKSDRLPEDLRARVQKCDGQPLEADFQDATDGKKKRTRVILCAKGDGPQAAERLEKALTRIEADSDLSPEAKAKVLAQLRAKIAELRAR